MKAGVTPPPDGPLPPPPVACGRRSIGHWDDAVHCFRKKRELRRIPTILSAVGRASVVLPRVEPVAGWD